MQPGGGPASSWPRSSGRSSSASRGWNGFDSLRHGLTPGGSVYGGTFYVLIGCHAVHVFVALVWLVTLAVLGRRAHRGWSSSAGLEMCTAYWYFVCGLWAFLFVLVYLN